MQCEHIVQLYVSIDTEYFTSVLFYMSTRLGVFFRWFSTNVGGRLETILVQRIFM